ncbi:MAG: hypothetical protein CR974_04105 [Gammaproteobacteria bacterium]|nr:MAG: hypothetical protein CR974_04105 [Gammaproteobacteria bacterium]
MSNYSLINNDTAESISMLPGVEWTDEFSWSPVAQSTPEYTRGGAQVIQRSTKLAGRPITLDGDKGWLKRGDIKTLQNWRGSAKPQMTLTLPDGRVFLVIFAEHNEAINYTPVRRSTPENDTDWCRFTLSLITA